MSLAMLKERKRVLLEAKRAQLLSLRPIDYVPHARQLDFHKAGEQAQERLFLAGNRCGKTLCGAYEMVMHLTGRYPSWWTGARFEQPVQAWAASVTMEATRDILQRVYMQLLPAHVRGRITMRRGVADAVDELQVLHISGGMSTLGFKSYDQGREKFQGTARHLIHLDEEPDIEIYEECLLRTATVAGHILLTMTPLKGMTTLCQRFLETEDTANSGRAIIRAGWEDAPHLQEEDKQRLRKSLRPHEVAAREHGIPSIGRGLVYPVSEEAFVVPRFDIPTHFGRAFGIDFGWTNPTAIVWGAYDREQDVAYITDVYTCAEESPATHAGVIQGRGVWIPGVCDPAGQSASQSDGQSIMALYAKHGVHLTKADNSVEAGIMEILERLRDGRLKVFAACEAWLREFRVYRRDEQGKIVKRNDHLMDATRYLIRSGLALARSQPSGRAFRRQTDWRTI